MVEPTGSALFIMWGTLAIYNLGIIRLLQITLSDADLKSVLREKSTKGPPTKTTETQETPTGDKTVTEQTTPQGQSDDSSFSRLAGMVGSVVLAVFLWGLGNVVLAQCFTDPAQIPNTLKETGNFFLAGLALFSPYAANKLSGSFKPS